MKKIFLNKVNDRLPFKWLMIPFFFLIASIQLNAGDKEPTQFSIRIDAIQKAFTLEKGDQVSLNLTDDSGRQITWKGQVINHLNKSENGGAISLNLKSNEGEYKLLMSRKLLNGQVKYIINLMEMGSSNAYKMTSQKGDFFILDRTAKENIVTP